MNTSAKIRWLLALICLSLFLTAILSRYTYSPQANLESSAKALQSYLQQKELSVKGFIGEQASFERLKTISINDSLALQLLNLSRQNHIYTVTYFKGQLSFWSSIRVLPENAAKIKNGSSFLKQPNGFYEAIKKTEGDFSVIFFIPVKYAYSYQNAYLQNKFANDISGDDNIEIADFTDQNVYEIRNIDHGYLFSVRLKPCDLNNFFAYVQILLWLSGMVLLCVFTNNLAEYTATHGKVYLSILIIPAFVVIIRFVNLYFHWPDIDNVISIFNPEYYASNAIFPSLGDFVINIFLLTWATVFVYVNRNRLIIKPKTKLFDYAVIMGSTLFLIGASALLLNLFRGLVFDSKINLDVNNVLNLNGLSFICVFMLCLGFFIFFMLAETCQTVCSKLNAGLPGKFTVFFSLIVIATFAELYTKNSFCFYVLWSLFVILRAISIFKGDGKFSPLTYLGIIVICASISSVELYFFQSLKEKETRKLLVQKLEASSDPSAEDLFAKIENEIVTDPYVINYFTETVPNHSYLKNRFQKLYFEGYLSMYDFNTYEYNIKENSLSSTNLYALTDFKDQVLFSAVKVNGTRYFYKPTNAFGFQRYFAMIPVKSGPDPVGTIVIELKSKPLKSTEPFPELLIEGNLSQSDEYKGYSYAFYSDNRLLNQSGKYVYSLVNTEFKGKRNTFVYSTTRGNGISADGTECSHLVYQPSDRKLIIVSKEDNKIYNGITSITFFFLVFLGFTLMVLAAIWLWRHKKSLQIANLLRWNFWNNFDKVLYRTRIQLSMVFAVVVTLLIIGFLTFLSVSRQYQTQQDDQIREKISRIEVAFEKQIADRDMIVSNDETQLNFNNFADAYSVDLTLFDVAGKKLLSTQPKLYESGLVAPRMNAAAFFSLARLQESGFISDETIGALNYKAAYAPIRNTKNYVVGFLQLPYFSNETEYRERIGAYLNTMINVYALVFIAIGLFAIGVARQITTPLTIIQQSLSNTIYGRKNEPIKWQHNDEIGSLIKEYNNMIAALEKSAQKLAQSERENAWREMAKQVAHEIKNPLTPLKLGLQLLEKAWKDKDPKFDLKFERFSASFVEQIDSLSKIASEFSNFARMPDTHLERFNIFDVIGQTITIFKQTDNFEIIYSMPTYEAFIMADRDQILRSFNNLLKNAIEAVPSDRRGIIIISHAVVGNEILITIKDNGNGIPEALRERIFVPNFTTKSSGTGLGLALVKNAIEYSGGSISFETRLNEGSTFFISFRLTA